MYMYIYIYIVTDGIGTQDSNPKHLVNRCF